ncbi:MAG: ABC-2 family transporter protein [Firmicutes bacterium]|nr:ABC-2 family transporter protein [Bacillota bacterium]
MSKYIEVFRLSFKMQIVWRFDAAMTMLMTFGRIFAGWILWRTIFDGKALVGGFTFRAMLSYYIAGSILNAVNFSNQISGEVSGLIREGRFSGHMVTPMNPMGFFSAMAAGESAFHLGFSILAAVLCAAVFRVDVALTGSAPGLLLGAAMALLGLTFTSCFQYFIGILAFKFVDITFFLHVQWNIIAFATGAMVPLALLPKAALSVLQFVPFTHVVYTPAMLFTGQLTAREGLLGLGVITAWTLAVLVIAQYTYGRLRVKYEGVGI